jgi:hypothetical protein
LQTFIDPLEVHSQRPAVNNVPETAGVGVGVGVAPEANAAATNSWQVAHWQGRMLIDEFTVAVHIWPLQQDSSRSIEFSSNASHKHGACKSESTTPFGQLA